MKNFFAKPLFIFEMANNHMGDYDHACAIIETFAQVARPFTDHFNFAFKFQYRHLDTFIHPVYQHDFSFSYIKRFQETRLTPAQFKSLCHQVTVQGMFTMATPFDERSVDLIQQHQIEIIKIASCALTDWPLLEKIALTDQPIIFSTAAAPLDEIDRVVTFFEHREKQLGILHCIGEYPTRSEHLELNQLDLLSKRYRGIARAIGFSTHEDPATAASLQSVAITIAKGAQIFERHVGLPTERYPLNRYSATPEQMASWLTAAQSAFLMCGSGSGGHTRYTPQAKEVADLAGLRRGIYLARTKRPGEIITSDDLAFSIPAHPGQLVANDYSKYCELVASEPMAAGDPVLHARVQVRNKRAQIVAIVERVRRVLIEHKIRFPSKLTLEISHHYGLDQFESYGCAIINCINREYCKKVIILLPGQSHPEHRHKKKEETFHILQGTLHVTIAGAQREYHAGELVVIERGQLHSFTSPHGAIFEEVSTTHYQDDSYYEDAKISSSGQRKSVLTFWSDWLDPKKEIC